MKKELVYSFTAFLAGVVTIIMAPTLSHYFTSADLVHAPPMRGLEQEVYATTDVASTLPTIFLIILISILIAGLCAFIVKRQSK